LPLHKHFTTYQAKPGLIFRLEIYNRPRGFVKMCGMTKARFLLDSALPGPANMARDEALLQACRDGGASPVLRFYAWSPATISLGYFQDYAEYERLPPPAGTMAVVRRTTGGGAILHDLELTYSIVLPSDHHLVKGRPEQLYALAHRAIIAAIGHDVRMLGCDNSACDSSSQRGPFFCFARRHGLDVVVAGGNGPGGFSKIAGSAQRRTATAILQHGSIMLDTRYRQQPVATWSALAGIPIGFAQAAEFLLPGFGRALGVSLEASSWKREELEAAEAIEPRYAGAAWTVNRQR
jgi:lipoyl(octanoyl) transferase